MYKYTTEFKLKVVKHHLKTGDGYWKTTKFFKLPSTSMVQEWCRKYKKHGVEGLKPKSKYQNYDGKFKQDVIEYMHANHLSLTETCMYFNLGHRDLVRRWERIYYEKGPNALYEKHRKKNFNMSNKSKNDKKCKKTEKELIIENEKLRAENAYLKKLNALVQERIKRENRKKQ